MLLPDEARQLDRLALASGLGAVAHASGHRMAAARGSSVEFQDFRRYQPGDDTRDIDWTIEARLRQLVVRVFRAEGRVPLHLLLDTSASMGLGYPSKLAAAVKMASALAYIAVSRQEPLGIATFNDTIRTHLAPALGRAQLFRVFEVLEAADAHGGSAVDSSLIGYGRAVHGPGLVMVLSDFFDRALTHDGVRCLLSRGLTVAVVQVLSEDEINPRIEATEYFVDVEDPVASAFVVDQDAVPAYQMRLARATDQLRELCARHRLPFMRHVAGTGFAELLREFVGSGLCQPHA